VAQTDKKQKTLIIGGTLAVLIIVLAIGMAVWVMSGNKEEQGSGLPYNSSTPPSTASEADGSIQLTPDIPLAVGVDGRITGFADVAALNKDFKVGSVRLTGDIRLMHNSDCLKPGLTIKAGEQCRIIITFDSSKTDPNASPTPQLEIVGTSKTFGGTDTTIEAKARIVGTAPGAAQAQPIPGATAIPGAAGTPLTTGSAPAGIDPYGPVAPQQASAAPPVDYTQAPAPRTLSPREQFMIARRQAVLGNVVVRNSQTNQVVSTGDWDELKIPKAVSSAPQDMSRVVTMDRIITAVLVRPFDSRLQQQVVAQVDRNVYGAMGRNILIPRGSTLVGTMQGGADRVAVVWTQIIRPDGARFVFNGSGGDAMGQAGVPGHVNNRWFQRIGAAFLGTVLKIGTAVATNPQETAGGTSVSIGGSGGSGGVGRNKDAVIVDITTQGINETLAPIIAQQKSLAPIITVPAGTRLTIVPTQDLVMRPIERETIVRQTYPRQMNGGAQISPPPAFDDERGGNAYAPRQQRQLSGFDNGGGVASTAPSQESIGRTLSTAPAAPSTTPPWGSN
jgi:type IV secretory pathway VirB10-like protein